MVLEGGQPNVYVRLQWGEGGQKGPDFCLRGLYTVPNQIGKILSVSEIMIKMFLPPKDCYFQKNISSRNTYKLNKPEF